GCPLRCGERVLPILENYRHEREAMMPKRKTSRIPGADRVTFCAAEARRSAVRGQGIAGGRSRKAWYPPPRFVVVPRLTPRRAGRNVFPFRARQAGCGFRQRGAETVRA